MHLPCICSLTFTGGSDTIQSYGGWRGNVEADLQHRFADLRSGTVSPRHLSSLIANQIRLPTYKERAMPAIPDQARDDDI